MRSALAAAAALTTVALLVGAGPARAIPLAPADLTVEGGEGNWHPANRFRLDWRNPDPLFGPPVAAVRYLVRDPAGSVAIEGRLDWPARWLADLRLPDEPGVYTAEIRLEDANAFASPAASAKLRYDDAAPPAALPRIGSEWIGRTALPQAIGIDRSSMALPVSGIRGYAVSIDRDPEGDPCERPSTCSDAETDLHGGPEHDSFFVVNPPEGVSYVHVVAVSGSGVRSPISHAALRVDTDDPHTLLRGAPSGWTNRAVDLVASATDGGSGMAPQDGDGAAFAAIRVDDDAPVAVPGPTARTTVFGEGVHDVAYYARDAAGNVNDGASANGQRNRPPGRALVRIDKAPPAVGFAAAQDPADPESILARVEDSLSGPSETRGSIGVRRVGSGDLFDPLPTRSDGSRLLARWDSEAAPPGLYEFRAVAHDRAGNRASASTRLDGSPMVLHNPLKRQTLLVSGFGARRLVWHRCRRDGGGRRCRRQTITAFARRPSRRLVPYGRGTPFSGRLRTVAGRPIPGAPITVFERLRGGTGGSARVSTARTGRDGFFSIRISPGPSREIVAAFGGTRALGRSAARPLRFGVRSSVRLEVSSGAAKVGGRPVVFTGAVAAPRGTLPREGKSIVLQFRLPGLTWSDFRTLTTNRRGRFRYAYRFTDDDSRGARFQFRARAPAQSGWPYEPGSSRPVAVRGR